jgi:hypothetical protein
MLNPDRLLRSVWVDGMLARFNFIAAAVEATEKVAQVTLELNSGDKQSDYQGRSLGSSHFILHPSS